MSSPSVSDEQPALPASDSPQEHSVSDSNQAVHVITFIDHSSYFNYVSSVTETPLLDRIKKAYCTLCQLRRVCEINGLSRQEMSLQRRTGNNALKHAKYSDIMPYANIVFVGIMDFAKSAFGNFTKMSAETRHSLAHSNFQLLQCLDGAYLSLKNFPEESKFMVSYTTFVNSESLDGFFTGCSEEYAREEVVKKFRQNFDVIKSSKAQFRTVKPTIDEFIVIFGLALWNGYTTNMSAATAGIVTRSRKAILMELQGLYARSGTTRYAARMAQVFGVLANIFRDIQNPSLINPSLERMPSNS